MKRYRNTISYLGLFSLLASCGSLLEHRTFVGEMDRETDGMFVAGRDFRVVSGDSGRAYRTREEIRGRTPASFGAAEIADSSLEKELAFKEKALTEPEYRDYLAVIPYLETTSEKIYYLDLSRSERDFYISSKAERITPKTMNAYTYDPSSYDGRGGDNMGFRQAGARSSAEIFTGMGKDEVMSLWGRPMRVDVAGDPRNQNERWSFYEAGRRKQVYFEAGYVQGWVIE